MEVADTLSVIERLDRASASASRWMTSARGSRRSRTSRANPMIIKIDQSFVRPRSSSNHSDRLLETIVSLGHNLGMTVLAEGIETQGQLEQLRPCTVRSVRGTSSRRGAVRSGDAMVGTSFTAERASHGDPSVLRSVRWVQRGEYGDTKEGHVSFPESVQRLARQRARGTCECSASWCPITDTVDCPRRNSTKEAPQGRR